MMVPRVLKEETSGPDSANVTSPGEFTLTSEMLPPGALRLPKGFSALPSAV
ncbi:MAG: hypothetical protein AB7S75_04235 [Desulfococcaceae bacterium]